MDEQNLRESYREMDERKNRTGNIVALCCLPEDTRNFSYRSGTKKASNRVRLNIEKCSYYTEI